MATTVIDPIPAEMPLEPLTITDVAFAHRWLAVMQQQHPDVPEEALRTYFACQADPSVDALQAALGCDEPTAAGWRKVLVVRLISPGSYAALFDAEDAVTACQHALMRYQEDVRSTAQRLQELQHQIEAALAYHHSLSDGDEQVEVQAKCDALDAERVTLLRHQGDLPGVGRILEHQMAEAQAALTETEADLRTVQVEALQHQEEQWMHELLTALEPVRLLLGQALWLSQAWKALGLDPGHEHGQERLRDVALARLRRG